MPYWRFYNGALCNMYYGKVHSKKRSSDELCQLFSGTLFSGKKSNIVRIVLEM